MLNTNVTSFRKNLFSMLEQTIRFNEPLNISTKDGNVVVLSEGDYRGVMETLRIMNDPVMTQKLIDGKNTPVVDCLSADEVVW